MFARISRTHVSTDQVDNLSNNFRETTPSKIKGMKKGYLLVDHEEGKIMTITLWENESVMKDAAKLADEIRAKAVATGGEPPTWYIETYEVADETSSSDTLAA